MARLFVRDPGGGQRVHELVDDMTTIGRATSNVIQIDSRWASREHCRIERTAEGFRLVDNGGPNGTMVNDTRVTVHDLGPGDVVKVGEHSLVYDPSDDGAEKYNFATLMMPGGLGEMPGEPGQMEGQFAAGLPAAPPGEGSSPTQVLAEAPAPAQDDPVLRALMGLSAEGSDEVAQDGSGTGGALKLLTICAVVLCVIAGLAYVALRYVRPAMESAPDTSETTPSETGSRGGMRP